MEHARKPFTLFEYMLLRRFLESVLQLRAIAFQLYVSFCRTTACGLSSNYEWVSGINTKNGITSFNGSTVFSD
jgi:hypothetical protein